MDISDDSFTMWDEVNDVEKLGRMLAAEKPLWEIGKFQICFLRLLFFNSFNFNLIDLYSTSTNFFMQGQESVTTE